MNTRLVLFILVGMLVASATADYLLSSGFYGATDDTEYFVGVHYLLYGDPSPIPERWLLGASRLGMTLPMALSYLISQGNTTFVAASFIVFHLGCVVLAYAIGSLVDTRKTALLASFFVAASPLFFLYSGSPLPDAPLSFWMALAMYFGLLALKSPNRTVLHMFIAGVMVGIAYTVKETGLLIFVPLVGILPVAFWGSPKKFIAAGLAAAIGLGIVFQAEQFMLSEKLRADTEPRIVALGGNTGNFVRRMKKDGTYPLERFSSAYRKLDLAPASTLAFSFAAFLYLLVLKRRKGESQALFLWGCFVWLVVYLTVGTTTLETYAPPSIQARYYTVAIVPGSILLAAALQLLTTSIGIQVGLALLIAGIDFSYSHELAGSIYKTENLRGLLSQVERKKVEFPDWQLYLSKNQTKALLPHLSKEYDNIFLSNSPFKKHAVKWDARSTTFLVIASSDEGVNRLLSDRIIRTFFREYSECDYSYDRLDTSNKQTEFSLYKVKLEDSDCRRDR